MPSRRTTSNGTRVRWIVIPARCAHRAIVIVTSGSHCSSHRAVCHRTPAERWLSAAPGPARLGRGEEPPAEREPGVTPGVDAGIDLVQQAGAAPPHDRVAREAARPQLLVVDDAPLLRGERGGAHGQVWSPASADSGDDEQAHLPAASPRPRATEQGAIADAFVTSLCRNRRANRRSRRRAAGRRPGPGPRRGTARRAPTRAGGGYRRSTSPGTRHGPRASGSAGAPRRPRTRTVQPRAPHRNTRDRQLVPRPDHDPVRGRRRAQHVQRLGRLHAEPACAARR